MKDWKTSRPSNYIEATLKIDTTEEETGLVEVSYEMKALDIELQDVVQQYGFNPVQPAIRDGMTDFSENLPVRLFQREHDEMQRLNNEYLVNRCLMAYCQTTGAKILKYWQNKWDEYRVYVVPEGMLEFNRDEFKELCQETIDICQDLYDISSFKDTEHLEGIVQNIQAHVLGMKVNLEDN